MKKIFRKNQLIITALALLIAVSGYINYMGGIKDKNKDKKETTNSVSQSAETDDTIEPGEVILTNSLVSKASDIKLNREQVRAKNLENLYEIVNNTALSDEEKAAAVESVSKIVNNSEKELAVELMLEGKGFENVIASINDGTIDIMLSMENVDDQARAQIEDMVVRKTGITIDNICITPIE